MEGSTIILKGREDKDNRVVHHGHSTLLCEFENGHESWNTAGELKQAEEARDLILHRSQKRNGPADTAALAQWSHWSPEL